MFLHKHFMQPLAPDARSRRETDEERALREEDEDIRRNLSFVLSTKRGCGYFLETFGLSEVTYRTPEEAVVVLSREIEENIRLFEPRVVLEKINEVYDDDGRRLQLQVVLRKRSAAEPLHLVFDLQKGTFDVRGPSDAKGA